MKKKIVVLILVMMFVASVSTFALGIGIAGTGGWGSNNATGGAFLTLKIDDELPLFGIDFGASENHLHFGLLADYWMFNENLAGMLNWYVGLGAYGRLNINSGDLSFGLGGRLPIGLNMFVLDPLELFIEIAPALGIGIGGTNGFYFPDWAVQGAFGFRFWF